MAGGIRPDQPASVDIHEAKGECDLRRALLDAAFEESVEAKETAHEARRDASALVAAYGAGSDDVNVGDLSKAGDEELVEGVRVGGGVKVRAEAGKGDDGEGGLRCGKQLGGYVELIVNGGGK